MADMQLLRGPFQTDESRLRLTFHFSPLAGPAAGLPMRQLRANGLPGVQQDRISLLVQNQRLGGPAGVHAKKTRIRVRKTNRMM